MIVQRQQFTKLRVKAVSLVVDDNVGKAYTGSDALRFLSIVVGRQKTTIC